MHPALWQRTRRRGGPAPPAWSPPSHGLQFEMESDVSDNSEASCWASPPREVRSIPAAALDARIRKELSATIGVRFQRPPATTARDTAVEEIGYDPILRNRAWTNTGIDGITATREHQQQWRCRTWWHERRGGRGESYPAPVSDGRTRPDEEDEEELQLAGMEEDQTSSPSVDRRCWIDTASSDHPVSGCCAGRSDGEEQEDVCSEDGPSGSDPTTDPVDDLIGPRMASHAPSCWLCWHAGGDDAEGEGEEGIVETINRIFSDNVTTMNEDDLCLMISEYYRQTVYEPALRIGRQCRELTPRAVKDHVRLCVLDPRLQAVRELRRIELWKKLIMRAGCKVNGVTGEFVPDPQQVRAYALMERLRHMNQYQLFERSAFSVGQGGSQFSSISKSGPASWRRPGPSRGRSDSARTSSQHPHESRGTGNGGIR
jgi:hypothetical protein